IKGLFFGASAFLIVCLPGCRTSDYETVDTLAISIDSVLKTIALVENEYYNDQARKKTKVFYQRNENHVWWLQRRHPRPMLYTLLEEIDRCGEVAMDPDVYQAADLRKAVVELYDSDVLSPAALSA